jgi:hypothetical protein
MLADLGRVTGQLLDVTVDEIADDGDRIGLLVALQLRSHPLPLLQNLRTRVNGHPHHGES